jgi:hypothetical protein
MVPCRLYEIEQGYFTVGTTGATALSYGRAAFAALQLTTPVVPPDYLKLAESAHAVAPIRRRPGPLYALASF